jgi:hypothetical protein
MYVVLMKKKCKEKIPAAALLSTTGTPAVAVTVIRETVNVMKQPNNT